MKASRLEHRMVEFIPDELEHGVIYVSPKYQTAIHLCCCGCGEEVVTPFSPSDWRYEIQDNGLTIYPSIGNWSYPCRSHYWLKAGAVVWAGEMSDEAINNGRRARERHRQQQYDAKQNEGLFAWIKATWRRWFG